jgi:squalene-hopene/tetraprenyl-beta-curcumene cyclase
MAGTSIDRAIDHLVRALVERRTAPDHWEGRLASSALSTGTAILALRLAAQHGYPGSSAAVLAGIDEGAAWLIEHQNEDGGWGDTIRSRTNISTTAIVWAGLSALPAGDARRATAIGRAAEWLQRAAGATTPDALRAAILQRYGKDQTFSVPILTVLALAGKLGGEPRRAWRSVPQLPFELAALPHRWFQHLSLPVVSYALPALIAIGQVRHALAPTRNPLTRVLRHTVRARTHAVLREMQPESGGYLEATPLTSFVVMSLAGMGWIDSPVLEHGVRFLIDSKRPDGSWPIDANLATWVTTLSISALAEAEALGRVDVEALRRWLRGQQTTREHPFTHAAPGAWAWTPLSGGVPDADDTAGALIALSHLVPAPGFQLPASSCRLPAASSQLPVTDPTDTAAAAAGARWLLGLQNRDGGIPTFCRGWGTLPFDRSTPEITAHALRAWSVWFPIFDQPLQREIRHAASRAVDYLASSQRRDGSWIPLWFGNESAPDQDNPVYGTARTLSALESAVARDHPRASVCRDAAVAYLLQSQNTDGGWGGHASVPSSIEETGVTVSALSAVSQARTDGRLAAACERGASWLAAAAADPPIAAAPVGLYFARLWYYEDLYPIVFALAGLAAARRSSSPR